MYYYIIDIITKMIKLYYKIMSNVFYYIGDIAWRIPFVPFYHIYHYSMNKSFDYDQLSGANLWKIPDKGDQNI